MFIRLSSVVLVLAVVVLGTPVKRDVSKIESDLAIVNTMSKGLDDAIGAFPNSGGTLAEAYAIHEAATALQKTIVQTTNDLAAGSIFTDEESEAIYQSLETLVLTVEKTSNDVVSKEFAISNVGVAPVALFDLKAIKADADNFGIALLAKVPVDQQDKSKTLIAKADTALDTAIKAYSN